MEGQVGTQTVRRVHVKAKRPKLGDVISTDFRVNVENDKVHTYAAPLPANSGAHPPARPSARAPAARALPRALRGCPGARGARGG